jgi:hypothetical protein
VLKAPPRPQASRPAAQEQEENDFVFTKRQQQLTRLQDSVAVGVMLGPSAAAAAAAAGYSTQDDGLLAIENLQLAPAAVLPCLAGSGCQAHRQLASAAGEQQQQQRGRNKVNNIWLGSTSVAAGTAALLDRYLAHHTLAALGVQQQNTPSKQQQHEHELLLQATAPADVLLTQAGSCPGAAAAPQWFVDTQAAAAVAAPGQQTTFTASPLQAGSGGAVHYWDVPAAAAAASGSSGAGLQPEAAAADVVVLVSGAKPCSGFRVWLQQRQQPGAEPSWVDVSAAASALPVVADALVAEVREFR